MVMLTIIQSAQQGAFLLYLFARLATVVKMKGV